jgi:benzoate membrane transport protein
MSPGGFSWQAASAGLFAAFVGFASSFAVIINGLTHVGASEAQAASGLMALSVAMGVAGIVLSVVRRMPISIAWSTPGAALLATSTMPEGGFPVAVGAFIVSGALIVLAGLWRPLGRLVEAIPGALANAMLAGVLLGLCVAPVKAVAEAPLVGLSIVVAWAIVGRINRLWAVPAAVAVAAVLIALTTPGIAGGLAAAWPHPVIVAPRFDVAAIVGIGLPLFLVTMASQNIPGMAVLALNEYRPPLGPLLRATGLFSLASAPFGGHAVNLAAITAALCAGSDAHPDPARRWWAAALAGVAYVVFGLLAGLATAFISASPPILIEAVAGLALLGAFSGALSAALADTTRREAAIVTFVVTASGINVAGVSGAFWGLVAGAAMLGLARIGR